MKTKNLYWAITVNELMHTVVVGEFRLSTVFPTKLEATKFLKAHKGQTAEKIKIIKVGIYRNF